MGWSISFDSRWNRDIGYGVTAYCDHPTCHAEIDRGLSYVCGGEPYGGERGCGLYFCKEHRDHRSRCTRCRDSRSPYAAKPDHPRWLEHKLMDDSWAEWRAEHPKDVYVMWRALQALECRPAPVPTPDGAA